MADALAIALYLIGLLATATSPLEDDRLARTKPLSITFAVALAWPVLAVVMVVARFWRLVRG